MLSTMKFERPLMAGNGVFEVPFGFTTSAGGVATLLHSFGGQLTIARDTNTYTITFPAAWGKTLSLLVSQLQATQVTCAVTDTPASKTIVFAFTGAFNSGKVMGNLIGSHTADG